MAPDGVSSTGITPLVGTDEATIDSKGRILLGKKKQERLGTTFAMAIGELGCICIYPGDRWQEILSEINRCSPMNKGRRAYAELFLEYADFDLNCDGQGRVVIPEKLRKQGKLGEKVLLRGCFDHLQIWDVAEHEKYRADREGYSKERREQMETAFEEMRKG